MVSRVSSCWWAALDEDRAEPSKMDSPFPRSPATMSRRSLRLHEPPPEHASHYGSASFSVGMPLRREPTSSKSSRRPQLSERTVVDSLWGLDDDGEPHESTIVSENSAALANSTLIAGGDDRCHGHPAQTQTSMVNGYPCRDCSVPSDRMEALHSSSRFPHVTSRATGAVALTSAFSGAQTQEQSAATSPTSTIYCRDKSRKGKMGVFLSVWDSVRSVCRRMAASLTLLLTLIYKHMLFKKSLDHEGALQWMLAVSKEATASAVSLLTLGVQVVRRLASRAGDKWPPRPAAHWGFGTWFNRASSRSGGNMESDGPGDKNLNQSGSRTSHPEGQVGSSVLRWLKRGWSHTVSFMSVLKNFLLVRCLPNLFKITLLLFLLILLSVLLGWWDPREVLSSMLPVDGTDWRDALPLASIPGLAALLKPPQETSSQSAPDTPEQDSERLQRLEQSMSELWERVEASGHRAEQMHGEVLGLYQGLRQELALHVQAEPDRGDVLEPWLDGLLEDKLAEMRGRLEEDRLHREQTRKQYMAQQKSQAIRLAELEQLLQALTTKMERVQQRQEAVTKATTTTYQQSSVSRPPTSVGSMDSESHDALRSDVSRLEVALGGVRQDLKGLRGCQGHCDHLDDVQETIFSRVRAQVREELRALLYGNQLWLAERYVSGADLRASLASLELSILHNTVVTRAVAESLDAAGAGVTEEQVQLMVRDALRLYSEDRTGLADYALESGGGSILSTRCSESYETRTAVLSLFGLPLWYFSQSPRAVIQPDVHPGNCWAFRGSTGYLVVRLSMKVVPVAFSLEHIPKALAPSGALRSAPRDFTVHGLDNEGHQDGKLLGTYSYEEDGEALQTYHVTEENEQAYQIIEVRILSNWGNPDYTCMYRLRVHGRPSDD
ncbi:hypothetical protein NHX12_025087 [Muraenolepis orangiensis]|uniref:SUN domain-containing protein n=1 Tax=Muraenolepis orangiensis TaxID=630683 RepID=A0A9Q0IPB7_9TELE|nr:hypothetical protein NHX12_025087 [Muraenolepis orangiensis]